VGDAATTSSPTATPSCSSTLGAACSACCSPPVQGGPAAAADSAGQPAQPCARGACPRRSQSPAASAASPCTSSSRGSGRACSPVAVLRPPTPTRLKAASCVLAGAGAAAGLHSISGSRRSSRPASSPSPPQQQRTHAQAPSPPAVRTAAGACSPRAQVPPPAAAALPQLLQLQLPPAVAAALASPPVLPPSLARLRERQRAQAYALNTLLGRCVRVRARVSKESPSFLQAVCAFWRGGGGVSG
jgi:hypothetical protein